MLSSTILCFKVCSRDAIPLSEASAGDCGDSVLLGMDRSGHALYKVPLPSKGHQILQKRASGTGIESVSL